MEMGKLPSHVLEDLVISAIKNRRDEVVERSGIGKDCAVVDYGDKYCVLSSDPITGAEKNIGKIAVHVACNDIAAGGAEPIALLMTILAPVGTTEDTIHEIMVEANEASKGINVEIVGGHTEITNAVNRMVLSMTAIGMKSKQMTFEKAVPGDYVLMTKTAGMEGSAIIAEEKAATLLECGFSQGELEEAKEFLNALSVVTEGLIGAKVGVKYMHDITEGGVEGAVWEGANALGLGVNLYEDQIPVSDVTKKICECFDIYYGKLISSGAMLMVVEPMKYQELREALAKKSIQVTRIGELTDQGVKILKNGQWLEIEEPGSDELYRVI